MTVPAEDRSQISSGERLIVVGGLTLGVASLVPWYQANRFALDRTRTNGWQGPDAILSQAATIVGIVGGVAVLLAVKQGRRPRVGSLSFGTVLTSASAVAFGLVALKFSLNLDNTTVGVYLGLVASATQLYGAYVTRLTESPPQSEVSARSRAPTAWPAAAAGKPAGPAAAATGTPASRTPASTAGAPSRPNDERWPETASLLSHFFPPGKDPAAAVAAYRQALGGDPARLRRLVGELRSLLDPVRSEAERAEVIAAHAPHLVGAGATAVLEWLVHAVETPPGL